ncbi:MAG: hypothetical protein [Inoviridae sp.]|nr:MAG: hypothetical protein [Inoviridae sp.]
MLSPFFIVSLLYHILAIKSMAYLLYCNSFFILSCFFLLFPCSCAPAFRLPRPLPATRSAVSGFFLYVSLCP